MERSPLATLSPELRNRIYEFALFERRPVAISKNVPTEAALLRTCRQIRQEAELLFYSVNNFTCMIVGLQLINYEFLKHWLLSGPANKLALIKSLTIRVEFAFTDMTSDPEIEEEQKTAAGLLGKIEVSRILHNASFGDRKTEHVVNFIVEGQHDDLPWQEYNNMDDWTHKKHELASFWMHRAAWGDKGCPLGSHIDAFIIFAENQEKLRLSRHGGETDSAVYTRRAQMEKSEQKGSDEGESEMDGLVPDEQSDGTMMNTSDVEGLADWESEFGEE